MYCFGSAMSAGVIYSNKYRICFVRHIIQRILWDCCWDYLLVTIEK